MVRLVVGGVCAALVWLSSVAYAQEALDNLTAAPVGPKAVEEFMSEEELEAEFGPVNSIDVSMGRPWAEETDLLIRPNPVRFERTVDISQLTYNPAERAEEMIPDDIEHYFDMVIYVSKAVDGSTAQQMFVFERDEDRKLQLIDRWLTSTGRERQERYFTTTPPGLFMLDPNRFVADAYSRTWGGAPMPYAMFFNYAYSHRMSGYAIHGVSRSAYRRLGQRASGGCVRLTAAHARHLFYRVQNEFAGMVPRFAFDYVGGTTFRDGTVERDGFGQIEEEWGYRVLLIVDTFGG